MRKIHFRHFPKAAGTSISAALRASCPNRIFGVHSRTLFYGHHSPWDLRCIDRPRDLLLFGAVRNPVDQVRSMHRQFSDRVTKPTLNEWIKTELIIQPDARKMLSSCEFIIKFENLQEDWKKFCEYARITYKPLPHHRNIKHIPIPKVTLTPESIKIINRYFRWVYDNYDYTQLTP